MSQKRRVVLVQCPTWAAEKPPLGIPYLLGHLRKHGVDCRAFDFNIELFHEIDTVAVPKSVTAKTAEGLIGRVLAQDVHADDGHDAERRRDPAGRAFPGEGSDGAGAMTPSPGREPWVASRIAALSRTV